MTLVGGLTHTIKSELRDQNPYLIKNIEPLKTYLLRINKILIDMRQNFYKREKEIEIDSETYKVSSGINVMEFLKEKEYSGLKNPDAIIMVNGTRITDRTVFADIHDNLIKSPIKSPIHQVIKLKSWNPKDRGSCYVEVKTLTGKTFHVHLQPSDTIEDLKCCIEYTQSILVDQIRLIYAGRQLENNRTLSDYFTSYPPTIHLCLRLRGGMFHVTSGMNDYETLKTHLDLDKLDDKFLDKLRNEHENKIFTLNDSILDLTNLINNLYKYVHTQA
jgi:hypothetical protein